MSPPPDVSFAEATRVWARIALNSFGGPAAQIAVMHRVVVEEQRWIGEARFLNALNYCMILPGPEAQQLATYLGWLMHGTRGGLVAGGLFVLPGFVSILAISFAYVSLRDLSAFQGLLFGLQAAVLAVVVEAVQRLGARVLRTPALVAIAVAAFVAVFLFEVPFPAVVGGAAAIGLVGQRLSPTALQRATARVVTGDAPPTRIDAALDAAATERPRLATTATTAATWTAVWLGPLAILAVALGPDHLLVQIGALFASAAAVTFGGAYAVLAWVAQQAVEQRHWLTPQEMLDGLGFAETTPGPLIQVVQFVAFVAAWRAPGAQSPYAAAIAASVLATWVTFAPSFLWIFTGAPYIEWLRGRAGLGAALSAISAAVVGVIANLGVWLALHVGFGVITEVRGPLGARWLLPELSTAHPLAIAIAMGATLAMLRFHVGMLPTLAAGAAIGLVAQLAG